MLDLHKNLDFSGSAGGLCGSEQRRTQLNMQINTHGCLNKGELAFSASALYRYLPVESGNESAKKG